MKDFTNLSCSSTCKAAYRLQMLDNREALLDLICFLPLWMSSWDAAPSVPVMEKITEVFRKNQCNTFSIRLWWNRIEKQRIGMISIERLPWNHLVTLSALVFYGMRRWEAFIADLY